MPLWGNAARTRITDFFKQIKPTSSRPISSRLAPSKVTPSQPGISKPRSPSTGPVEYGHEGHSLPDLDVERHIFALPRTLHNLAPQSRARASNARVKNLVKLIEKIRDGKYEGEQLLIRRKLTYSEYVQLLQFIENSEDEALQAYFNDKLRFDYTSAKKEFVIRMTSFLHDGVARGIGGEIQLQLAEIRSRVSRSDERAGGIIKGIRPMGTPQIYFALGSGYLNSKAPDECFKHRDCEFPGLIIEVSWSQRKLDLPSLAEGCIQASKGEIRTVVGVNLNDIYTVRRRKGGQTVSANATATFSVWRAEVDDSNSETKVTVKKSVEDQVFRDEDGSPVPSVALELSLKDLICENVAGLFGDFHNLLLVIPSESLCELYEESLRAYLQNEARRKKNAQIASEQKEEEESKGLIGALRLRRSARLRGRHDPVEGGLEGGPRRSARLRDKTGQASMSGANPRV